MIASSAPEPSRTLAILFGASRWPEFPGLDSEAAAPAYLAAAASFRDYLLSEDGLGLPQANLLDLFDSSAGVVDQDRKIRKFILDKASATATIQDLIVMFIGHGSTAQNHKFIFILRSTSRDQRELSAYKSENLGRALKDTAPTIRKWVFLDCCAASAAYGDFQPASEPAKVMEDDAEISFPPDGAAFYAACDSSDFAYNDPKAGSRMFTAALTDVLKKGDPTLSERLTLSEVAALTLAEINRRHGPDRVRPYLGNPDQRKGELSSLPFFPNPARRKMSVEAQLEALQSTVTDLERSVEDRLTAFQHALDERRREQESLAEAMAALETVGPASLAADGPSSPSAVGEIDTRVRNLNVAEQRRWDERRIGTRLSIFLLAFCAWLLMFQLFLTLYPIVDINLRPSTHRLLWALQAITTAAAAVTAMFTTAAPVFDQAAARAEAAVQEDSDELVALLRNDPDFRKIYCDDYCETGVGPLHRRKMVFASVVSMLAVLLGGLSLLPGGIGPETGI
jgi:hypothetical protein